MSSAVIEVILGVVFVFFLFSMLCSGINEFISRAMNKRADFLAAGRTRSATVQPIRVDNRFVA